MYSPATFTYGPGFSNTTCVGYNVKQYQLVDYITDRVGQRTMVKIGNSRPCW